MTVLLSCSTSWSKNECDTIPSTGGLTVSSDSVPIAIDDLRKVNAKLVELKYEKEINDSLRSIIDNDDKIIGAYYSINNSLAKQVTQVKRQRNIAAGGGLLAAILLVISIIVH